MNNKHRQVMVQAVEALRGVMCTEQISEGDTGGSGICCRPKQLAAVKALEQCIAELPQQAEAARKGAAADMDVTKRPLAHGIEALAEIKHLRAEVARLTPAPRGRTHSCDIPGCAVCDPCAGL
jgi:hypothetical protein